MSDIVNGKHIWTGGYRAAGGSKPWTGMWKWSDGSSFSFSKWGKGEPNNHGVRDELFILSNWGKRGAWNDARFAKFPFACKCRYFF